LTAWFVYQIAGDASVKIKTGLEAIAPPWMRRKTLPKGLLGQAIDYTLKRWEALTRFVDAGRLVHALASSQN
jgi:transposase IS66 family protein